MSCNSLRESFTKLHKHFSYITDAKLFLRIIFKREAFYELLETLLFIQQ